MDTREVLQLLAVPLLVASNAFFVAAEFALVALRRGEEGRGETGRGDGQLARARREIGRPVSATQLGITMSSLGLGWVGENALAVPISMLFVSVAAPWSGILTHGVALTLAFAAIVFLHILLAELAPKTIALLSPDSVARAVSLPLNVFAGVMSPVLWVLNRAALPIVRRTGGSELGSFGRVHSPEEIELLLRQSRKEGVVEEDEEEMIHGVFELTRTVAREVMTPRPDIVALPDEASLDEVLRAAAESGYSRFPVYHGSIDEVVGVVLVKDLITWLRDAREDFRLAAVMREPFFVPDTKPVDDLLAEFRRRKLHLAVVVDEFGGTDGVVTLEDLVEEIVGDIFDEHDVLEEEIQVVGSGRARIDGGADLQDLIEEFELRGVENADEYDTLAGYVIGQLGRIPEPGEVVRLGSATVEVLETLERRVTALELRLDQEENVADRGEILPEEDAGRG